MGMGRPKSLLFPGYFPRKKQIARDMGIHSCPYENNTVFNRQNGTTIVIIIVQVVQFIFISLLVILNNQAVLGTYVFITVRKGNRKIAFSFLGCISL
jgi:hypothetical protein